MMLKIALFTAIHQTIQENTHKDRVNVMVEMIRAVKNDKVAPALQEEFFRRVDEL